MTVLAWIVLIGILCRCLLLLCDDGFGGPAWETIWYVSGITWLAAFLMAVHVITGWTVTIR